MKMSEFHSTYIVCIILMLCPLYLMGQGKNFTIEQDNSFSKIDVVLQEIINDFLEPLNYNIGIILIEYNKKRNREIFSVKNLGPVYSKELEKMKLYSISYKENLIYFYSGLELYLNPNHPFLEIKNGEILNREISNTENVSALLANDYDIELYHKHYYVKDSEVYKKKNMVKPVKFKKLKYL